MLGPTARLYCLAVLQTYKQENGDQFCDFNYNTPEEINSFIDDRLWLPITLTSSCLLFEHQTWAWRSSRSQTSWVTWRSSRCKWSQCRLRRFPSAGWCNALQTPCWTSAARQSMRDKLRFSNMKNLCNYERKSTKAPNPVQLWEQW